MEGSTIKGYNPYDVMSALQKSVRRGMEEEALFWAFEFAESGLIKIPLARLKVMAHEDIGTGDMTSAMFAIKAIEDTQEWYPTNGAWRLSFTNAVLALCRANKSRDSDNAQAAILYRRRTGQNLEIPDYAFDKHTRTGKKMGRGVDHFCDEATILDKDTSSEKYKDEARKGFKYDSRETPLFVLRRRSEESGGLGKYFNGD
jgi:replication-associated recombination protein RarA